MNDRFDVAIIGSGPAGYVAALRAAELGFQTVCIDSKHRLGGTCLHEGCIPSKTLLEETEFFFDIKKGREGITHRDLHVDFSFLMKKKEEVIHSLEQGIQRLFQRPHLSFIGGRASFLDPHKLLIDTESGQRVIEAAYILIATGSCPIELSQAPFDKRRTISSKEALGLTHVPKSLAVLGGGSIGLELASVYRRLGTEVTLIEMMERLSPHLDRSLSVGLKSALESQGMSFLLSSHLKEARSLENEVVLKIETPSGPLSFSADYLLVAIGRRPFTEGLQLEKVRVAVDEKGFIKVDRSFRATLPHVFAVGDVIGSPMLAHKASAEAIAVIHSLAGIHTPVSYIAIPSIIYTDPEVASVGMSEEEVKERALSYVVGWSYFKANARARCSGKTEGFVKLIGEKNSRRLLGVHIIAPRASELVAQGSLAMQEKLLIDDLAKLPQAHPTLSEALKEAASHALSLLS